MNDSDSVKPPLLYHYTSTEGLIGILKEDALCASDLKFVNDPSELIYTKELFESICDFHGLGHRLNFTDEFKSELPPLPEMNELEITAYKTFLIQLSNYVEQSFSQWQREIGYTFGVSFCR